MTVGVTFIFFWSFQIQIEVGTIPKPATYRTYNDQAGSRSGWIGAGTSKINALTKTGISFAFGF
jgi:hypothetical protein